MLLKLTVKNYRSFKGEGTLDMIASNEQRFRSRLPKIKKRYDLTLTPVAAIFGANAAGKSNFVEALKDLQELLIHPPQHGKLLPYTPFLLDKSSKQCPTDFQILFTDNDVVYEYSISYDSHRIVSESLIEHLSRTEHVLFLREGDTVTIGDKISDERLKVHLQGVPDNVALPAYFALMKEVVAEWWRKITIPYTWARSSAIIGSRFLIDGQPFPIPHLEISENILRNIDLGVAGFERTKIDFESLRFTESNKELVLRSLRSEPARRVVFELESKRFEVFIDGRGELVAEETRLRHHGADGHYVLEWAQESEGTRIVIRLLFLFALLSMKNTNVLLLIDELDRSFHTELSRALIDGFLANCNAESRSQLIFTTHDLLLLDPDRFRRDEMWVVEKNLEGSSNLISIAEYNTGRKGADLRKAYLAGRFGGVPSINPLDFAEFSDAFNVA